MRRRPWWIALGLVGWVASGVTAQQAGLDGDDGVGDAATARRAAALAVPVIGPVTLDGVDDEEVWATAIAVDGFRQFSPEQDAPPSQRTSFRAAFSETDLYFFVRAYDTDPDSIMRALSRRDTRAPSDQIGVIVDSYNDRRTGFSFWVNPDGVQRDFAVVHDGQEDPSWNGVWDVATRVDSLGWTAEFKIPLSQLRYAEAEEHVFGFGVRRDIERLSERVSWPLYSRTTAGLASQLGELGGIRELGSQRRLEISPYLLTKNVTRPASAGGFEHVQQAEVGADLKLGLGPNVTLDATVNPDFGQVEADPAVLNLTAFETFFSERRPFFVEGTGLYGFSLNCYIVVDCNTNEGLFYSRRIGRAPTLAGLYGDAATPSSTPIAGALKLTGRRAGGLSFGALGAVTLGVDGTEGRTAEPATSYAVLRAQQDLRDGDAGVGLIATAVNRATDAWTAPFLHKSAYVTGADARTRFGDRNYEVRASIAVSRIAGSAEAVERTQRSPAHYFQQPGDHLTVDPTRTSLSGYSAQLKLGKYAGGITRFETSYVHQSAGFEPNDLGFLRRSGIRDWSTWAALSFQDPTRVFRWAQVNANSWHHWNEAGDRLQASVNVNGHMGLHNNWSLHAGGTVAGLSETYCDRCTRGGPTLRQSGALYPWFGLNGDSRKTVVPNLWVNLGYWDEGASRSASLSPNVQLRFSSRLRVSLGVSLYRADNHTQWLGNFTDDADVIHYSFAHLDQRTISLNARINYTLSRDLSFEFYGQPFVSNGAYSDVREVTSPDAGRYDDRFVAYTPPDGTALAFSARQLRTNAVLRWEYRPGSAIFLVWAHGRQGFVQDRPRMSWNDELSELWSLHPDNTLLVKVSYWFNP